MEFPKRKHPRLSGYDYTKVGSYFVTICTIHRDNILSEITVGHGDPGTPQNGQSAIRRVTSTHPTGNKLRHTDNSVEIALTSVGKVAEKYICSISQAYDNVTVDKYVIMPNHIHMILTFSQQNNKISVSRIIGVLKRLISKDIGANVFQTSFIDHIIRDEEDYWIRYNYIEQNPLKRALRSQ